MPSNPTLRHWICGGRPCCAQRCWHKYSKRRRYGKKKKEDRENKINCPNHVLDMSLGWACRRGGVCIKQACNSCERVLLVDELLLSVYEGKNLPSHCVGKGAACQTVEQFASLFPHRSGGHLGSPRIAAFQRSYRPPSLAYPNPLRTPHPGADLDPILI